MISARNVAIGILLFFAQFHAALAQDSDHDGLSDALEQSLLVQFAPNFMVARDDCSGIPAEFVADNGAPAVKAENGAIYGQVFPVAHDASTVEIHFYHLWSRDCGEHGHALDTEHVSALVHLSGNEWKALYWYAGAHEKTICDTSQIARASKLHAEDHGPMVWISPDKHASYFDGALVASGCGGDKLREMMLLESGPLINLGEVDHPMNGSAFIASPRWPLAAKMSASNFPVAALARVDEMPVTEIALFNAGRHPVQGVVAISSSTEASIATGGHDTLAAVSTAHNSTNSALSEAETSAGNALGKSYRSTVGALGVSVRSVGKALHLK